jgi:hypothetical protein
MAASGVKGSLASSVTNRKSGRPVAVLDTKYKTQDHPATEDIEQIVTAYLSWDRVLGAWWPRRLRWPVRPRAVDWT